LIIDSSYFVQVEYLNVTDSNESYPYVLNGCREFNCSFGIFTNIYVPRFPDIPEIECIKKSPPKPPTRK